MVIYKMLRFLERIVSNVHNNFIRPNTKFEVKITKRSGYPETYLWLLPKNIVFLQITCARIGLSHTVQKFLIWTDYRYFRTLNTFKRKESGSGEGFGSGYGLVEICVNLNNFSHLQHLGQDLLPPGGVLLLHDGPLLGVRAIPRGHSDDLVVTVSILARLSIRVAVVVDDGEAGPHNGLRWIVGVLLAEVHVVPSVRVGITKSTQ